MVYLYKYHIYLRKLLNEKPALIGTILIFRQKLRKYIKNEFEEDVAKFRENPDEDDDADEMQAQEEKEDDDDIDSDTEVVSKSDFMKPSDAFKKGM